MPVANILTYHRLTASSSLLTTFSTIMVSSMLTGISLVL